MNLARERLSHLLTTCSDLFQTIFQFLSYEDILIFDEYLQESNLFNLYFIPKAGLEVFSLNDIDLKLSQVKWLLARNIVTQRVQFIDMQHCCTQFFSKSREILTSLTLHESKYLHYCQLNYLCPKLHSLTIKDGTVDSEVVGTFLQLHPTVQILQLLNIPHDTISSLFLHQLNNLHHLNVSFCTRFTDHSLSLVVQAIPNLKTINFDGTAVDHDQSIVDLKNTYPDIQSIIFNKWKYSDQTVSMILKEVGLRSLTSDDEEEFQLHGLQFFLHFLNLETSATSPRGKFLLEQSLSLDRFVSRLFEILTWESYSYSVLRLKVIQIFTQILESNHLPSIWILIEANLIPHLCRLISSRNTDVVISIVGLLIRLGEFNNHQLCDSILSQQFISLLVNSTPHLWSIYCERFSLFCFLQRASESDLSDLFVFLFQEVLKHRATPLTSIPKLIKGIFRLVIEVIHGQQSDIMLQRLLQTLVNSNISLFLSTTLAGYFHDLECVWYCCYFIDLLFVRHTFSMPPRLLTLMYTTLSRDLELELFSLICGCLRDFHFTTIQQSFHENKLCSSH